MQSLQTGQNTQRVISNDKLIDEPIRKPMSSKTKAVIAFAVFFAIAAIIGVALGLYFHFKPTATHIQTVISTANDGTIHSSTKFQYTAKNMIDDNMNQTFTVMFAGMNSSHVQQRMLQTATDGQGQVDATLHYTHPSGIKLKFRGHKLVNISVSIDQVAEYIAQQEDPAAYARLLESAAKYDPQNQTLSGTDLFNTYRDQVMTAVQGIHPEAHVSMIDLNMYDLIYDENTASYNYNNSTDVAARRRRLGWFSNVFHAIGNFVSRAASGVVHFVEREGPTILKYAAITALAGVDILEKGPSGIGDAINMYRSGNVWKALETTAQGAASAFLTPWISYPLNFVANTCFSNPPHFHCTWGGAVNAIRKDVFGYVEKREFFRPHTGFMLD